ncbi:MAG: hypothetical protein IPG18_04685 [Saprospiraceae bacterium]|nr:hypothetical protein [Saprospiraceae bacterium]
MELCDTKDNNCDLKTDTGTPGKLDRKRVTESIGRILKTGFEIWYHFLVSMYISVRTA